MPQRRVGGTAALACWSPCVLKKSLADCPDISILKTLLHPRRNEQAAYRWPPRAVGRIPRMVCDLSTSVDNASARHARRAGVRLGRCPAGACSASGRTADAPGPPRGPARACEAHLNLALNIIQCRSRKPARACEAHPSETRHPSCEHTHARSRHNHGSLLIERSVFGHVTSQNPSWQKAACPKKLQSHIHGIMDLTLLPNVAFSDKQTRKTPVGRRPLVRNCYSRASSGARPLPSVAFLDRRPCKTAVGGEYLVRKRYVRGVGVCDGCRLLGGNQLEHALIRIAHGRGANHGRGAYRSGRGHNRMPSLPFTCEFTLSPESALRRPTPLV